MDDEPAHDSRPQSAEGTVHTERPSRYLVQLGEHISRAAQPHGAQVEYSDDRGTSAFGWGSCTFRVAPGVLLLRAEAADERSLQRLKDLLSALLERVGRRDDLTVNWAPARTPTPADQAARVND